MAPHHELLLHQELLILSLRDDRGTPKTATCAYAVAGGILLELVLQERVGLEERRRRRPLVVLRSGTQLGDPVLDDALRQVRLAPRPSNVPKWLGRWAGPETMRDIAVRLTQRGTLRTERRSVLVFFSRTVFPQVDPGPRERTTERIRTAVEGEGPVDPRTAALVTIAAGAGFLRDIIGRRALRARKARLEALADGSAVEDENGTTEDAARVARLSADAARTAAVAV